MGVGLFDGANFASRYTPGELVSAGRGIGHSLDLAFLSIVEKFGDRPLTWETAEKELSIAAFEIKQAALLGEALPW